MSILYKLLSILCIHCRIKILVSALTSGCNTVVVNTEHREYRSLPYLWLASQYRDILLRCS